jgi:hypothetical protein
MVRELLEEIAKAGSHAKVNVLDLSVEAGHFPLTVAASKPSSMPVNFYGIDRDTVALQVASRLAQFAFQDPRTTNFRFQTASIDSLLDPLPQRWPRQFNAILGNPPWKARDPRMTESVRRHFWPVLRGHYDMYLAFLLRAHGLVQPGGYLCFVLPSAFLFNHTAAPVRRILLDNYDILSLRMFPQRSFVEVPCVIPVAFLARKRTSESRSVVPTQLIYPKIGLGGPERPLGVRTLRVSHLWAKLPGHVIHPLARPDTEFLLKKLPGRALGDLGKIRIGVRLVLDQPVNAGISFRGIRARDIRPFHVCLQACQTYNTKELLFERAPDREIISAEKVVFPDFRYMTHRQRVVAAIAGRGTYPVSTAGFFLPIDGLNLYFVVAVLNSSLANAWYKIRDVNRSIKLVHLRQLPVPLCPKASHTIVTLAQACEKICIAIHQLRSPCTVVNEALEQPHAPTRLFRRLGDLRRAIDDAIFDLYELSAPQRAVALRLAKARVF